MMLSPISNKTAFFEHKTSAFHFNIIQVLHKLLHIKMCPLALRHPLYIYIYIFLFCISLTLAPDASASLASPFLRLSHNQHST
jgi:hypothetical protein